MKRIMGLDVGDKTIGVAVSDPLGITSQGVTTIRRKGIKSDIEELKSIIEEYSIEKVVIGLPKNMNNTIGPQGEKVLKFTAKFKEKFSSMIGGLESCVEPENLVKLKALRDQM